MLRDAALDYAARGWPVFPVTSQTKRPMLKQWQRTATADPLKVYAWWSHWPRANIGTPTGLRFDVIDLDGPAARAEFERLCEITGTVLGGVPMVKTGRPEGGWQLYIKPTGMGNRKPSSRGVDFRGRGGFVIVPPSIHASGRVYTWLTPWREPPELPAKLRDALWPKRASSAVRSHPSPIPRDPGRDVAWAWAALQGLVEELAGAGRGSRNETLNRVGFRAFQLCPHLLSPEDVESALLAGAEACGLLGDDGQARVSHTIQSAKAAGMAQPRYPGGLS
jgi:hypothetical protein